MIPALAVRVLEGGLSARVGDEMTWPAASPEMGELAWRLRYGMVVSPRDQMAAAGVVDAYLTLIHTTTANRNRIASALKRAKYVTPFEEGT